MSALSAEDRTITEDVEVIINKYQEGNADVSGIQDLVNARVNTFKTNASKVDRVELDWGHSRLVSYESADGGTDSSNGARYYLPPIKVWHHPNGRNEEQMLTARLNITTFQAAHRNLDHGTLLRSLNATKNAFAKSSAWAAPRRCGTKLSASD